MPINNSSTVNPNGVNCRAQASNFDQKVGLTVARLHPPPPNRIEPHPLWVP